MEQVLLHPQGESSGCCGPGAPAPGPAAPPSPDTLDEEADHDREETSLRFVLRRLGFFVITLVGSADPQLPAPPADAGETRRWPC